MLNAALLYVIKGWSIIPLYPKNKHPLIPWQEHQQRRATPKEIIAWWNRWPGANVGIVTGQASGLVVLDLDGPEAAQLAREKGLPVTPCVRTGKGWHYYFSHPGQQHVRNAVALLGRKGLDLRADGGYIVAPPSIHPNGRRYAWAEGRGPDDLPLAPLPAWVLAALQEDQTQGGAVNQEPGWVERLLAGVPEGGRNDACARLAGHFLAKGLPEGEVLALLLTWNAKNSPPLPRHEVEAVVKSVARREARKPPRQPAGFVPTLPRLDGPVFAPPNWNILYICPDWAEARRLAGQGHAVAVLGRDGKLPAGAAQLLAAAEDVKIVGLPEAEARRLAWEIYPLRLITRPEGDAGPALETATSAPNPAPETVEAAVSAPSPPSRFAAECWLNANRPDLLNQLHQAQAASAAAWLAGDPAELAQAEARMEAVLAEAQREMEMADTEAQDPFERAVKMFEARRTWALTPAQAARMEKIFQEKGPVVVRVRARKIERWLGAEEYLNPRPPRRAAK